MPLGLRNLGAYGLRYSGRASTRTCCFVTPTYPTLRPDAARFSAGPTPRRPIRLAVDDDRRRSRLTTFFRLFLAVPHIVWLLLWGIVAVFAVLAPVVRHPRYGAGPRRRCSASSPRTSATRPTSARTSG